VRSKDILDFWQKPPKLPLTAPVRAELARRTGRRAMAAFWDAVDHNRKRVSETEAPDLTPLTRLPDRASPGGRYDVLFVSNTMLPVRGGGARSFLALASQLARRGLRVAAVCGGPAVKTFEFDGVDFTWIVHEDDLAETIARHDYGVLFCQQVWAPHAAAAAQEAKRSFWYFLRSIDDLVRDYEGVHAVEELAVLAKAQGGNVLIETAGEVVANSKFMGQLVQQAFGRRCEVIYPGIETPEGWEKRRTKLSRSVVAMGGSTKKGIEIVVELARAFPAERFLVCGVKALPSRFEPKKLPENMLWLGRIEGRAAFALAKLVLMPSQWPEPLGRVCPEALVRGIPVLASRVGGIPEVVQEARFLVSDFTSAKAWQTAMKALLPEVEDRSIRSVAHTRGKSYQEMQQVPESLFKSIVASASSR